MKLTRQDMLSALYWALAILIVAGFSIGIVAVSIVLP
jgi:hypothetical protein